MRRMGMIVVAGSLFLTGSVWVYGTDEKPASGQQTGVEFREILPRWQAVLADIAETQTKMLVGSQADREAMRSKLSEQVNKAEALLPQLQSAAEKSLVVDDTNRDVTNLLFAMAIDDLRKDNYEQAWRLTNLLLEHKYPEKEIYRLAASAVFPLMKLDEAKKYLEAAAADQATEDEDIKELLARIEHYRGLWEREQKRRDAEAKADDLPRVKLHTTQGDIVLELFENEAPNTVANFISLVEKGFYDGTQFHRVIPGFMAQGGDPSTKEANKNQGRADDGPGYTIADECIQPNHREHFRGSLSMAHRTDRNTGGSQFFITLAPTAHLDGIHTVFGRVIEGVDVLAKLQRIDPSINPGPLPHGAALDKIIKAEVLRKRDHPYEPQTIGKK